MGYKSNLKNAFGANSVTDACSAIFGFTGVSAVLGVAISGVLMNFFSDEAQQGSRAGHIRHEYYDARFGELAAAEERIVKLQDFADHSEVASMLAEGKPETVAQFRRAQARVAEEKAALKKNVDLFSRQLLVDVNVNEAQFDGLVRNFDAAVSSYALPAFLKEASTEGVALYDSQLRECQIKIGGTSGEITRDQAENITACTKEQIVRRNAIYAAGMSGLALSFFFGMAPALSERRRKKMKPPEQPREEPMVTTLKIIRHPDPR